MSEHIQEMDLFFAAAKQGDIDQVKLILQERKIDINSCHKFGDFGGVSALIVTCWNGHYDLAEFLLEEGALVNSTDDHGWCALKRASIHNHYEVVKLLLDKGADVDVQNNKGWTALMNACSKGHYRVAKLLLERGAKANLQRESGRTALISASMCGRYDEVNLLIENGAHINIKDRDHGGTALMYASYSGHTEVVKLLIAEGVDVDLRDNNGISALMKACDQKHYKIIICLLENGATVDLLDNRGWSALMFSVHHGYYEVVKVLLSHGADIEAQPAKESPLTSADPKILSLLEKERAIRATEKTTPDTITSADGEERGTCSGIETLTKTLSESSKRNVETNHSKNLFFTALLEGDINQVKLMLHENNISIYDCYKYGENGGWSALMIACWKGYYNLAKFLLGKGIDVNLQDDSGWSALKRASFNDHYEIVELLLDKGADVDLQDQNGWTALMNASRKGHYRLVKLLLERGADVNLRRISGRTALMSASECGRYEEAKLLLEKGAEVNVKDYDYGRTALMYASFNGHTEVAQLLITKNIQDKEGQSTLMTASCEIQRIILNKYLLEKGAYLAGNEEWVAPMLEFLLTAKPFIEKESLTPHSKIFTSEEKKGLTELKKIASGLIPVHDVEKKIDDKSNEMNLKNILEGIDECLKREASDSEMQPMPRYNEGTPKGSIPLNSQQLWRSCLPLSDVSSSTYAVLRQKDVPFVEFIDSLTCDQRGRILSIHDIEVSIPPGAIPDGVTAHIEMGVALYGPFKFPDNHQPVSPILWFCIRENIELLLPLKFKLPHMITDIDDINLTFAKANHLKCTSKGEFLFQTLSSNSEQSTFTNASKNEPAYGWLSMNHSCYLCIQANSEKYRDLASKRGYCLHILIEKQEYDSSCNRILLVCTYLLKTCLKALKSSYPEDKCMQRILRHSDI